jgi:hypothetical protein
MATRRGGLWCPGIGLLALALAGCSDSGTPPVAPPPPTGIVIDYTAPTRTLETLAKGIEDKNRTHGVDAYMGALADSFLGNSGDGRAFHAFFDIQDIAEHPWPYDWTREFEPLLLRDLFLRYPGPFEMTWGPYEAAGNETGTADDSLLHRKYTLVQVTTTGTTVRRDVIAVGAADLHFVRSARTLRWVIAQWQDYHTIDADADGPTMGRRRLETQP